MSYIVFHHVLKEYTTGGNIHPGAEGRIVPGRKRRTGRYFRCIRSRENNGSEHSGRDGHRHRRKRDRGWAGYHSF